MDEKRKCIDCGDEFVITEKEKEFFEKKKQEIPTFQLPKRCKNCRIKRRTGVTAYK